MVQGCRVLGVEIDHGSEIQSFRGRDRLWFRYTVLGVETDRSWFRDTEFLGIEIDHGSGIQSLRGRDRSWFRDTEF